MMSLGPARLLGFIALILDKNRTFGKTIALLLEPLHAFDIVGISVILGNGFKSRIDIFLNQFSDRICHGLKCGCECLINGLIDHKNTIVCHAFPCIIKTNLGSIFTWLLRTYMSFAWWSFLLKSWPRIPFH